MHGPPGILGDLLRYSDYTTLMVEILRDNARLEAGPVYGALDMDWAKLGQISAEHAEK